MSQWDAGAVKALRAGVYNADGSVVRVVRGRLTEQVLQLAGDGLLDALAKDVEGAVDLAAQCAAALRERSGMATKTWPTNWRRPWAVTPRRCFAHFRSISSSWLRCSKAIRSAAVVASTYGPASVGLTRGVRTG